MNTNYSIKKNCIVENFYSSIKKILYLISTDVKFEKSALYHLSVIIYDFLEKFILYTIDLINYSSRKRKLKLNIDKCDKISLLNDENDDITTRQKINNINNFKFKNSTLDSKDSKDSKNNKDIKNNIKELIFITNNNKCFKCSEEEAQKYLNLNLLEKFDILTSIEADTIIHLKFVGSILSQTKKIIKNYPEKKNKSTNKLNFSRTIIKSTFAYIVFKHEYSNIFFSNNYINCLSLIIEYITSEIIEIVIQYISNKNKNIISVEDINNAIFEDKELNDTLLFNNN